MKYQKTAKTYEEQADLLIGRKMMGDRSSIIEKLPLFANSGLCDSALLFAPKR